MRRTYGRFLPAGSEKRRPAGGTCGSIISALQVIAYPSSLNMRIFLSFSAIILTGLSKIWLLAMEWTVWIVGAKFESLFLTDGL